MIEDNQEFARRMQRKRIPSKPCEGCGKDCHVADGASVCPGVWAESIDGETFPAVPCEYPDKQICSKCDVCLACAVARRKERGAALERQKERIAAEERAIEERQRIGDEKRELRQKARELIEPNRASAMLRALQGPSASESRGALIELLLAGVFSLAHMEVDSFGGREARVAIRLECCVEDLMRYKPVLKWNKSPLTKDMVAEYIARDDAEEQRDG